MKKILIILSLFIVAIVVYVISPLNESYSTHPHETRPEICENSNLESNNTGDSEMVTPIIGEENDISTEEPITTNENNDNKQFENSIDSEDESDQDSDDVIQLPVLG